MVKETKYRLAISHQNGAYRPEDRMMRTTCPLTLLTSRVVNGKTKRSLFSPPPSPPTS